MTLIFDWDGTLHNTLRLYGHAFRAAYKWLVEGGFAPEQYYSDEQVSRFLGMNTADMWRNFMPDLPGSIVQEASSRIGRELVRAVDRGEAQLYDGVPEMLEQLHALGYTLVFLSNCQHDCQEAHRKYFHLDLWFSGYFCCEDYQGRPKEEIFLEIAAQFPGPYLVIGDRDSDMRVAQVHGLKSIGCLYGFGTPEELCTANERVMSCGEIPDSVQRLLPLEKS